VVVRAVVVGFSVWVTRQSTISAWRLDLRGSHQLLEEARLDLLVQQPLPVLGVDEVGRRP
jgi:hypothetical protein